MMINIITFYGANQLKMQEKETPMCLSDQTYYYKSLTVTE